jgi:hypothetical protein
MVTSDDSAAVFAAFEDVMQEFGDYSFAWESNLSLIRRLPM